MEEGCDLSSAEKQTVFSAFVRLIIEWNVDAHKGNRKKY